MSEPQGPTGVITLKKIADMTYEQYGTVVLDTDGGGQITFSDAALARIFQPDIEAQMTWIEDFASRLQGAPNPNQSSSPNDQAASWPGGNWGTQGVIATNLLPQATLSGAVRLGVVSGVGPPEAEFNSNETFGLQQITSHVSRNPIFYMRWAHAGGSGGGLRAIGWHRRGQSFTVAASALLGAINFRWLNAGDIVAVCSKRVGGVGFETTLSMGVTVATGSYHTGRAVVTGGGTNVEFFLDGVSKGNITTNIPDEGGIFALVPGLGSDTTDLEIMDVDYMALSQQRTP